MSDYKKHLTKADFDNAKNVNIVDYCTKAGIPIEQTGPDSFQGVEHDSLKITPSKNAWFWFSQQKGGYGATSFVKDFVNGGNINTAEAAKIVLGQDIEPGKEYKAAPTEPFKFDKSQLSPKFDKARDYMINIRKLSPQVVDGFHKSGLLQQDKYGNAIFIWRVPGHTDDPQAIVGASKQGTTINHAKYGKRGTLKRVEKNSFSGWGFVFDISKDKTKAPNKLVFCESCIDAMSYYENAIRHGQNLQGTRIVSMEGLKPKVVGYLAQATLNQLEKEQKGRSLQSIKLAVDQDEAGSNFIKKVQEMQKNPEAYNLDIIAKQGLQYAPPIVGAQPDKRLGVKDWNELIQKEAARRERGRERENKQVRSRDKEDREQDLSVLARRREAARPGLER